MNSIWLSLLWKEWREHRLLLLILSVVALLSSFFMWSKAESDLLGIYLNGWFFFLAFYSVLAGLFLGMSVAGRENSRGTAAFLFALPMGTWRAAVAKILVASATAILPILLALGVVVTCFDHDFFQESLYAFDDGTGTVEYLTQHNSMSQFANDYLLRLAATASLATISLLVWTALLGANRSDEIRAGALGFLGIVGIWFLYANAFHFLDKYQYNNLQQPMKLLASMGPGGPIWRSIDEEPSRSAPPLPTLASALSPVGLLGLAGAIVCFLYRFGRLQPNSSGEGVEVSLSGVAGIRAKRPFRSQLTALAWKQFRETGPLALFALTAVLGLTSASYWADSRHQPPFGETFLQVSAATSMLVVMVAGIGLFLEDLKPGISDFWRSRPANLKLWFGVKYVTGIIVLATFLGLPAIIAGTMQLSSWDVLTDLDNWLFIGTWMWAFLVVYSLTMLMQCLLRQPIYAVVLAMAAFFAMIFVAGWIGGRFSLPWSAFACVMLAFWAAIVLAAWKAVRHDWGWKH